MNNFFNLIFMGIKSKYFKLIIITLFVVLIKKLILIIIKKQLVLINNNKTKFKILYFIKNVITILEFLIIYLIWENNLKNIMSFITFISAALTLSLKDFILNLFAGIYIRVNHVFKVCDRIEIDENIGDVINIGTFSFDIIEASKNYSNQSSGIVLTLPNSIIFAKPLKNYNKGFNFIWHEINIKLTLNSDINNCKKILYKIINSIEVIKNAPDKMRNELNKNVSYRMYFNKLEPIIYTNVLDDVLNLQIRFLINPKRVREVDSYIWTKVIEEYNNGNLKLIAK